MKEDWTNKMKQKLEGHKMSPPAGLWKGISSEMGLQPEPATKTIVIKRWALAVAAVILALVGFFAVYQFNQSEPLPQTAQSSQAPQTPVIQTEKTPVMQTEKTPDNHPLALANVPKRHKAKVTPTLSVEATPPTSVEANEGIPQEETPQPVSEEETAQQTAMVASRQTSTETRNHAPAHYQPKQVSASEPARKWTVGLNASGGLLASVHQNAFDTPDYLADDKSDVNAYWGKVPMSEHNSNNLSTMSERPNKQKHHLPLHLGLSLHYQLNNDVALLSGISYSYLHSEFIFYRNNRKYHQELHYLGIPLGLSWQLWKNNRFSLYLSGAAILEKCLNEKPWQWSLNAAAGAEYAITPQFGIFLEPSLGYYFNDGTSFEHYYKEHPLAPSIEFGLRLHISGKK